ECGCYRKCQQNEKTNEHPFSVRLSPANAKRVSTMDYVWDIHGPILTSGRLNSTHYRTAVPSSITNAWAWCGIWVGICDVWNVSARRTGKRSFQEWNVFPWSQNSRSMATVKELPAPAGLVPTKPTSALLPISAAVMLITPRTCKKSAWIVSALNAGAERL